MRSTSRRSLTALAASLVASAAAFLLDADAGGAPWGSLAAWLLSMGLFVAFARGIDDAAPPAPLARGERWLLAALFLLALAVRVVNLAQQPWPFGGDESEQAFVARAVLDGRVESAFRIVWLSQPTLFPFVEALSMGLAGDGPLGARLPAAFVGAAAIPALYVFARRLVEARTAALAAGLLAVYHVHVALSRVSMFNIADPLVGLLAMAALLRALETGSARGFAASGLALGLALHGHPGQRLSWLLAAAAVAHHLVARRPRLRPLVRGLAVAALGFLIAGGPLIAEFLRHPAEFNGRLAMSGVFKWIPVWRAAGQTLPQIAGKQLRAAFGAYTSVPDRSPFYGSGRPLLDFASSVFFVLGLVRAARRWRETGWFVVLAWIAGASLFGGALMASVPDSPRYLTVLPAVCLVVAFGAAWAAEAFARLARAPRAAPLLAGALVAALGAWNLAFYFGWYLPSERYAAGNDQDAMLVAQFLRAEPPGRSFELLGAPRLFARHGPMRFLAPLQPGHDLPQLRAEADVPPAPLHAPPPLFVAVPERAAELELVRARHPSGRVHVLTRRGGPARLYVYDPAPGTP